MVTINIETLQGLPIRFINCLAHFNTYFKQVDFLEFLEHISGLRDLISDINSFCEKNQIIGFHYTRANPESIKRKGLIPRSGIEIRKEFLNTYGYLFTKKEIGIILKAWENQFSDKGNEIRDYHIFFNLTQNALKHGGANLPLEYYGGEQVYHPLYYIEGIKEKLHSIGTPMILKCKLNPKELNTFIENPWGSILVSSYHRLQNSNANVIDQDAYQFSIVPAKNITIIKVISLPRL
jgi:hypothetical protein